MSARATLAVLRRELLSLFVSPMAYVILFVFLLVNGATFQFYLGALDGNMQAILFSQFGGIPFWFLCMLVPPLIAMRSFTEERRTGTFELLVSTGVTDASMVAGKFLACWAFFLVLWVSVLPLLVLVDRVGRIDWGVVASLYVGLAMLGATFTAFGVLASSLTQNQLIAAILAVVVNLGVFFLNYLRALFPGGAIEIRIFEFVSPLYHFGNDFSQGVLDLRYLALYGGTTLWALFVATKVLERRRWS